MIKPPNISSESLSVEKSQCLQTLCVLFLLLIAQLLNPGENKVQQKILRKQSLNLLWPKSKFEVTGACSNNCSPFAAGLKKTTYSKQILNLPETFLNEECCASISVIRIKTHSFQPSPVNSDSFTTFTFSMVVKLTWSQPTNK